MPRQMCTARNGKMLGRAVLMFASSIAVLVLIAGPSFSQGQAPIIYPSQGQSLEQQSKDQGDCRGWAQQQTGFNTAAGV